MSDNKSNKPVQVIIQGKITGRIDPDGTEHQTYRYHVNIHEQNTQRDHTYDKEIHIFKTLPPAPETKEPANKPPYLANENISPAPDSQNNTQPTDETIITKDLNNNIKNHIDPVLKKPNKFPSFRLPRIKRPEINFQKLAIKWPSLNFKPGKFTIRLPIKTRKPAPSAKSKDKASKPLSALRLTDCYRDYYLYSV